MFLSYSQISVYESAIAFPFNAWSKEQYLQGFAWRNGSVSFRALIEDGQVDVSYGLVESLVLLDHCVRSISLPFTLSEGHNIVIATITERAVLSLSSGQYQVVYSTGRIGDGCWIDFAFVSDGMLEPLILVCDDELTPAYPLDMSAIPAS